MSLWALLSLTSAGLTAYFLRESSRHRRHAAVIILSPPPAYPVDCPNFKPHLILFTIFSRLPALGAQIGPIIPLLRRAAGSARGEPRRRALRGRPGPPAVEALAHS